MQTVQTDTKTKLWNLIDDLNEEQSQLVITYIGSLPRKERRYKNGRTEEEVQAAVKAFEELEELLKDVRPSPVIRDDKIAVTDAVRKKYESLN